MTSLTKALLFLVIWFVVVPPATARIALNISREQIGASILAWIDRNFYGTRLAYLVRCPICLSHWIILVIGLACWRGWELLPFSGMLSVIVPIVCMFATVEITRRLWLKDV